MVPHVITCNGNTRFHKGFQKRTDGTIKADMRRNFPEVQAHSEAKVLRATRNAATRTRNIARYTRRNGNIITGEGTPAYNPGSRKHFDSEKTEYMVRETRARDVNSMGRFHIPISPRKQTRNAYRQEPRLKIAGRKRSSVLGYGRHDIQSLGVLDNFSSIPIMKAKKVVNEGRELPLFDSN